jgi:hypothetical protein
MMKSVVNGSIVIFSVSLLLDHLFGINDPHIIIAMCVGWAAGAEFYYSPYRQLTAWAGIAVTMVTFFAIN